MIRNGGHLDVPFMRSMLTHAYNWHVSHLDTEVPCRHADVHVTAAGHHVGRNLREPFLLESVAGVVGQSSEARHAERGRSHRHQVGTPCRGDLGHRLTSG